MAKESNEDTKDIDDTTADTSLYENNEQHNHNQTQVPVNQASS